MTTAVDPKQLMEQSNMRGFQLMAVAICIALNALDGFDVLAISFAAPGIASEWSINRAELGVVLAMELAGMALGSITLGGLADHMGRRPTILVCLMLMTVGMYLVSLSQSVNSLLMLRFVTGLGIGGMLASTNAMVAEYSNAKYRNLAVILMATGYPVGAMLGGAVVSELLIHTDWRGIFEFGAICNGAFLVVVWFFLPESVEYLCKHPSEESLHRVNLTLKKLGHQPINALPPSSVEQPQFSYGTLLSKPFRRLTVLLCVGYFFHIMTFYYVLKWIPKIVVDMGYDPSTASTVLVWANLGGACGALLLGLLSHRFSLKPMLMAILLIAALMVSLFGLEQSSLTGLTTIAAATGFFTNAGVVGFYALMASSFPAHVRASGTGLVIGIGRGGAALGPVVGGLLFTAGFSLLITSVLMALGALLAAAVVYRLGSRVNQEGTARSDGLLFEDE